MIKILINDGLEEEAIDKLKQLNVEIINKHYKEEELETKLKSFDVIIIRSATTLNKKLIDRGCEEGRLKLIIRGGVGLDNIDTEYARKKGIKVMNTPYASCISVAEIVIAHMFSLARHVNIANVTMRKGEWNKKKYVGVELTGKTLGIIGMGRIGKELAKRAYGLGMKVIYYDGMGEFINLTDYEFVSLKQLLSMSDFISLHVSGSDQIIGKHEFDIMKEGVFIINTSRGKTVNEKDLLDAINSGKVRGAGLDVFSEEPSKNIDLLMNDRVSITPHIGASTEEAQQKIGEQIVLIIKEQFKL